MLGGIIGRCSDLPDEELWRDLHVGDDDILIFIYEKYANDLIDYGLKLSSNNQLVQDCIQEVFLHLITKKDLIDYYKY